MKIAILPGDGIGPEIVAQAAARARRAARATASRSRPRRRRSAAPATTRRAIRCPTATLAARAAHADAVLLGAVGGPQYDALPRALRPEQGILGIRKALGLFANLRPALLYPELADASTLKPEVVAGLDIMIVRELTGDIYFGQPRGPAHERRGRATRASTRCTTASRRSGASRASASRPRAARQRKLCSVDKANVLDTSILWREVVTAMAAEYPDVALSHMYVDNAAMQLVRNPKQFDVIVTGNMFGDILSDEASMLAGSIGMLPSASLDAQRQGPVRADPRFGARHRRPGPGQSAGDDPVAGDDVPLHVRARRRRGAHRGARCARAAAGLPHRRHRAARRDKVIGTRAMGDAVVAALRGG